MLFLMLAAAVTPAAPIDANKWFSSKDYSKTALDVANRGGVAYRIDVAPDGKALRCTAGNTGLDARVCEILMKSARFVPAKDALGQPAYGLHDGMASFLMPGKPRADRARLVVPTDALPAGIASPAYTRVGFLVDAAGTVSGCASLPSDGRRRMQTVEALGPQACEAVMREYRPVAARDAAGTPVASVQSVTVRFDKR